MPEVRAEQRRQLRRSLLARRSAVTDEQRQSAAREVARRFLSLDGSPATIAGYLACGQELPVTDLLAMLRQRDCVTALPLISGAHEMRFVPFCDETPLHPNRFGILEPVTPPDENITIDALDTVLVPLVGFDRCGNRMGMGGGFYDRFFERRRHGSTTPMLVGIGYDCQQVESVLPESWDVTLDMVLTESRTICFDTATDEADTTTGQAGDQRNSRS